MCMCVHASAMENVPFQALHGDVSKDKACLLKAHTHVWVMPTGSPQTNASW